MATTKNSRSTTRRKTRASGSGAQTNGRSSRATASPKRKTATDRTTSGSGTTSQKRRTSSATRTASPKRTTSRTTSAARNGSSRQGGASGNGAFRRNGSSGSAPDGLAGSLKSMGGTLVHGMDRAKPALAVGATAVGIAGGIVLRRRHQSTLPFGLPRTGDGIDIIAVSKAVGKASARLGQTAKSVSKDLDIAADRAERIGKILS